MIIRTSRQDACMLYLPPVAKDPAQILQVRFGHRLLVKEDDDAAAPLAARAAFALDRRLKWAKVMIGAQLLLVVMAVMLAMG